MGNECSSREPEAAALLIGLRKKGAATLAWGMGEEERSQEQGISVHHSEPLQDYLSSRTSTLDFLKHICTFTGEAWWYQRKTGLRSVCGSWYKKYKGWTSAMNKNIAYMTGEVAKCEIFINSEIVCMPGCSRNNWTQFWPQGTHTAPQWSTQIRSHIA